MSDSLPRVLVVDDEPNNLLLMESILSREGFRTLTTTSGRDALRLIRRSLPDLVLLDAQMPGLDGFEVCRRLRRELPPGEPPIVLVTVLDSVDDRVRGLEAGADDFLTKPVRPAELIARARGLVEASSCHRQLRRANEELERANAELEQLNQWRDAWTQMLVHDLKSPLAGVVGFLELIQTEARRRENLRVERLARRGRRSCGRMLRMILHLLDIARLEHSGIVVGRQLCPLRPLLDEQAEEAAGVALGKGASVVVEADDELPSVSGEPDLLRRLVANLVDNALQHSPPGGVVRLRAAAVGGGLQVEVEDQGPGIAPEDRERVFEKFVRVGPSCSSEPNRGLGLTFCRLVVEAHGGHIRIEDAAEQGCRFVFWLPLVPDGAGDAPSLAGRTSLQLTH